MKPTQFKTAILTLTILILMFNAISDSVANSALSDSTTVGIAGAINQTPPSYATLSYYSSPVAATATVNGNTISSGETTQITAGSTVTIQAGQTQGYDFSHWLINNAEHTENPLILEVTDDLTVTAVYTAQPSPPPTSEMIVGVNMWSGTSTGNFRARDAPLLKQAGINFVRIGTGVSDAFVNAATDEGISVIGTFGTNGLPDLNDFGDYVYDRVTHFKGRVNAWVVFNEANWDAFNGNAQGYTEALQVAYTRAKQADPNVKIVTSNFLSTEGGLDFLEDMYGYGAQGYFDVLGIDPYCNPEPPTEPNKDRFGHTFWNIPKLHDLMAENGDGDKPIWIVEFGYRTPSDQYPLDHSTVVSEEEQAEYIVQALELARTWPWLERFYIYEWMDSADVNLGHWGLIKEDYVAPYDLKPAYYAIQDFLSR